MAVSLRHPNTLRYPNNEPKDSNNEFIAPSSTQPHWSPSEFAQEFLSEYYSRVSSCLPAAVTMYSKEASRTHFEPSDIFGAAVNKTSVGHSEIHEAVASSPLTRGAWTVGSLQVSTPSDESGVLSISVVILNDGGYKRAQRFAVKAPRTAKSSFLSSFAYWDNVILSEVILPVAAQRRQFGASPDIASGEDKRSPWGYPTFPSLSLLHGPQGIQPTYTVPSDTASDEDAYLPQLHPLVLSDLTKQIARNNILPTDWATTEPTFSKSMPCTPRTYTRAGKTPKMSDGLTSSTRALRGSGEALSGDEGSCVSASTMVATPLDRITFSPRLGVEDEGSDMTGKFGTVDGENESFMDGNGSIASQTVSKKSLVETPGKSTWGPYAATNLFNDSMTTTSTPDYTNDEASELLSFVFSGGENYMSGEESKDNDVSKRLATLLDTLSATKVLPEQTNDGAAKLGVDELGVDFDEFDVVDSSLPSAKDETDIGNLLHAIQTETAAACDDLPSDIMPSYCMATDSRHLSEEVATADQSKVDQNMVFDVLCTLLRQNDKKDSSDLSPPDGAATDVASQVASLLAASAQMGGNDVDVSPFKSHFVFEELDEASCQLPSVGFGAMPFKSSTAPATPHRASPVTPVSLTPALYSKAWLDDETGYLTPLGRTAFDDPFTLTGGVSSPVASGGRHTALYSMRGGMSMGHNRSSHPGNAYHGRSVFSPNFDRAQRHDLHISSHPRLASDADLQQHTYEELMMNSAKANMYYTSDEGNINTNVSPRYMHHRHHGGDGHIGQHQTVHTADYLNQSSPPMMFSEDDSFGHHHMVQSCDVPSRRSAAQHPSTAQYMQTTSSSRRASPSPSACSAPATQSSQTSFNISRGKNPTTNAVAAGGPTFWGMWEDERDRMVYVSWLPRVARATDRTDKKKCELQLKEFIGVTLGFKHLEKVLLFPPSSAHCKLIFKSEVWAQRFLDIYGGLEGTAGPESWKQVVCNEFDVNIKEGIESTRVKVIWADQTKNERTVLGIRAGEGTTVLAGGGGGNSSGHYEGNEGTGQRSYETLPRGGAKSGHWQPVQAKLSSHSTTPTPLASPRGLPTKKKSKLTSSKSQPNCEMQSIVGSSPTSGNGHRSMHPRSGSDTGAESMHYMRDSYYANADDVTPPPPTTGRTSRRSVAHMVNPQRATDVPRADFSTSHPPSSASIGQPPLAPWSRYPTSALASGGAAAVGGGNPTRPHDIYRSATPPIYAYPQTTTPYGMPHQMYYFPAHPAMLSRGTPGVSMPMYHHSGYNM